MDAPNDPNPANPNAQDQNVDVIQGPANQAQGPVVQNQNYGEMQILENFKNNLPYRLYLTLINVNNLRDDIDLAKRVLTKEKLDRQLTIFHPIHESFQY